MNSSEQEKLAAMIVANLVGAKIIHPADRDRAEELVLGEINLKHIRKLTSDNPYHSSTHIPEGDEIQQR